MQIGTSDVDARERLTELQCTQMEIVPSEQDRGRAECEADIAIGRLRLFYQTRGAWGDYMANLLNERFDIMVVHTSDMTTAAESSFQAGYNQRMAEYVNATYGASSFESAMEDVETFRMQRYQEYLRNREHA
ncbi:MAG: hypothetical protein KDB27_35800 [Planctomycetales bacterium]|nr:hypothetical protein [Planctomycetales bacterium]